MKTEITEFWNCFSILQMDLIAANRYEDFPLQTTLFTRLQTKATDIHPKLSILVIFQFDGSDTSKLVFLTKGDYKLKAIAEELLAQAPQLEPWVYQIGIKPYKHSIVSLCANYKFIDASTIVFQIYFAIERVYKTSNKLHLLIYLEMDKRHSKADLHDATDTILLWFLGDSFYYRHISRFKIVRRKYSAIRFIPFDELKNIIQFKHLN